MDRRRNYTRSLQGQWERSLKNTMFSPFATAGMTMNRNAINTILGTGPQFKDRPWIYRVAFGDALKGVITWALINKAYTGDWPWNQKDSKLLKVKLKPEHRNSMVGRMLGGDPKNGDVYVDIGLSSPLVGRGARQLGLQGAYDTKVAGGSADQVAEAALVNVINSAVSPVMGPPAKMAFLGITGSEPFLTGIKNDRGQLGPQFFPAVNPQKPGMEGFLKQHVVPPLLEMNSLATGLAEATGFAHGIMRGSGGGMTPTRFGANFVIPNIVPAPTHPANKAKFLANQRKAAENAVRKRERTTP